VTARLKAWALVIAAAGSLVTALTTAFDAHRQQANDYEIVRIMAEQLAAAREGCQ
jgi:hypothetical protein